MGPTRDMPSAYQLPAEILRLKKERHALLLAHYYQDSEIQELADVLGDSLQLSQAAARTEAPVIVFAGVHFMAETAKILNPDRIVVLPDTEAGCSLADSCPPAAFRAWRARHPEHVAVSYINCSAEVKALSDVICTSSNAETIVRNLPRDQGILFGPDRHLGAWVARRTGRELVLWQGACVVHEQFSEREVVKLKVRHPEAELLAHPECEAGVLSHADFVGSTTALLHRVRDSKAQSFIVATEEGILHQMRKAAPDKQLFAAPGNEGCACNVCPHMKRNTLEKLYLCLRDLSPRIELEESVRLGARAALERMFTLGVPNAQVHAA
ncbi:MAG: quinolinate synthase NadA [Deltaproteobacteria bacterium]